MITIKEHGLSHIADESQAHRKFTDFLRELTASSRLDARRTVFISILYGVPAAESTFHVAGYKEKNYTIQEDIEICRLRGELDTLVNSYAAGIDGVRFRLALAFDRDPFADAPDGGRQKVSNGEEAVLNILPVEPRFRLEQMILEAPVREQLDDVITLVSLQDKIYDDWGFGDVDPKPRAVINFYGPSGTGKTMAAHALAQRFGKKILALNYADIESKFVGDAPKNLMAAFEIARKHDALLFFDEADSFLGKRITNVSQSADQAVNSLRSQLLMLLEEHSGVVVFATNLMENYDSAFNSRILKHIQFKLPATELRFALIKKMIPARLPRNDADFSDANIQALAEISEGFSGREIKNAMLNGIIRSAKHGDRAEYALVRQAFEEALTAQKKPAADARMSSLKREIRKKLRRTFGVGRKRKGSTAGPDCRTRPACTQQTYRTVKAL